MARIRTVKPEFWTDDRVGECSVSARLLFIATWNFADDQGGLERSAKQLKAQAFPYDNLDCEALIQELLGAGCLIEYESGGKKYLHIRNFRKHQRIEKPAAPRYPVYEDSLRTPRLLREDSESTHRGVTVSSLEGKGMEGKGISDTTAAARPTNGHDLEFESFKTSYPKRSGAQPWARALKAIHARLAQGATWTQIAQGASRYARFCEATGKLNTEYVMQAATFCGPEQHFLLPWTSPQKPETASEAILRKLNEGPEVFDSDFIART